MASEALRRLAARIAEADDAPRTSDIIEFPGDNGDNGDSLQQPRVFLSPNGAALGDTGDKSPPAVTNVTNIESVTVTEKPAELAAVTNVTNVTTKDDRGGSTNADYPHRCFVCGGGALFGFGPPGWRQTLWTCFAHRPDAEARRC